MLLNQTAEYALRAMTAIASLQPGVAATAADLAESTGIPPSYLHKILRRLVVDGLITSRKGHGGGFALALPPERIRFADVLSAVDAMPKSGRCAFGWGLCDASAPCPLHGAWSEIDDAIQQWASRRTLADVGVR